MSEKVMSAGEDDGRRDPVKVYLRIHDGKVRSVSIQREGGGSGSIAFGPTLGVHGYSIGNVKVSFEETKSASPQGFVDLGVVETKRPGAQDMWIAGKRVLFKRAAAGATHLPVIDLGDIHPSPPPLDAEKRAYRTAEPTLLALGHRGKWATFFGDRLLGVFEDHDAAYMTGRWAAGEGRPFLTKRIGVREVSECDVEHIFPSEDKAEPGAAA